MKRILCVLLSGCLLLCLAACSGNEEESRKPESTGVTEALPETPPPTAAEAPPETEPAAETEVPPESEPAAETEAPQETEPAEIVEDPNAIRPLNLEKSLYSYYEWADELPRAMVRSEHSIVTLGGADAERYPEMAQVLSQIATMQENAMLDEFDNLVSFALEELSGGSQGFETYVSTLDVQVRRADSLVVSLLSDSYSDYGQIHNCRVLHGSNYDTRTGRELMLNEVVDVNNYLALAVEKELTGHMWTGEFYYKYIVEDYFANMPYHGFNWTLDYTGVTFYFAPGDLCDEGPLTATVSYAEYPELFVGEYMEVPAEYTAELALNSSFFTELDGDGMLEEIAISARYDEERNHYLDYAVSTDTNGGYYSEQCYVYDFHPYYVKAEQGNFLYLFCEDFEEGLRQMRLIVLKLNPDGTITKSGEVNVCPSWLADNKFIMPTDPGSFLLDDLENGTENLAYSVGTDGLPGN